MGDEEKSPNAVGEEALKDLDVSEWNNSLGSSTILGPLKNSTRLGMEDGCLVDWAHVKDYQEPTITYSMSYGCLPGWTKNFTWKTIFAWLRENLHEFVVGFTIALTLVRNKIAPYRTPT